MPAGSPVLSVSRVSKSFGRRAVLREVSLDLRRGQVVGVTGENGAGKSTLLNIIVGRLRADRGTVDVQGRFGFCPQEPLVFEDLTVSENFRYFASAYGLTRSECSRSVERLTCRLRFQGYRDVAVSRLSGGTRQKLNLSLALLHEPDILVLDEPYSGFDWETYLEFWNLTTELRNAGRSVLIVSHFVHDRERFDALHELVEGRFKDGQ